jgi:hypothetical protein
MRRIGIAIALVAFAQHVVAQTCTPASAPPLLNPAATGLGTMSRQATFDYLVNVWFDPTRHVIQEIACPTGTCLWVPWYSSSTSCNYTVLHTDCGITPDGSYTMSCLASDELSQVGLALSMSDKQAQFDEWVTTIRFLIANSTTVALPAWLARRNGSTLSVTDGGDASDATARIIIALYVGANNDRFPDSTAKASYRALANNLAHAFIQDDFATRIIIVGGVTITHWLGGGSGTAMGHSDLEGMDSWSGYYGDAVIALLAAYRSTSDPVFLSYARDTIASYLVATSWDGNNFSVPPEKFTWSVATDGVPHITCDYCAQWGFKDAPRAVSLCKAPYYAALNGVDLGTSLDTYCARWMQSTGVKADAYQPQYSAVGAPVNPPAHGYYQNGLGAAINFAWQPFDLWPKLSQALSEFSTSTNSFNFATCMGVYDPAFLIVSLGSAIGDDIKAFTNCDGGTPDATPPAVLFRGSCGYVLDPYRLAITLHGVAIDNRAVQSVTYSLSGSTSGSGIASGTATWGVGPLMLNSGTTIVTVTAHDGAGNTAVDNCSVAISVAMPLQPMPRHRAARP